MMERPMTTEELFNRIQAILKEKGKLPEICEELPEELNGVLDLIS